MNDKREMIVKLEFNGELMTWKFGTFMSHIKKLYGIWVKISIFPVIFEMWSEITSLFLSKKNYHKRFIECIVDENFYTHIV